jgi:hypothetical protein
LLIAFRAMRQRHRAKCVCRQMSDVVHASSTGISAAEFLRRSAQSRGWALLVARSGRELGREERRHSAGLSPAERVGRVDVLFCQYQRFAALGGRRGIWTPDLLGSGGVPVARRISPHTSGDHDSREYGHCHRYELAFVS